MTLRGILWHKGINGLGVGPKWLRYCLPYHRRFDVSARYHDSLYDKGGNDNDRAQADRIFFEHMLKCCINGRMLLCAVAYYKMVRWFGWAFFRYNN